MLLDGFKGILTYNHRNFLFLVNLRGSRAKQKKKKFGFFFAGKRGGLERRKISWKRKKRRKRWRKRGRKRGRKSWRN